MKDYFEQLAPQWDRLHPPGEHAEAVGWGLGELEKHGGSWEGKTLIDVGCGTGVLLPHLLKGLGEGRLWAVDHAEGMLKQAKARHVDARIHFICEDALSWRFAEGSADGVLCYNSFPHFPQERALRVFASWLRPGGFFLCWHGAGRRHINRIHREAGPAVAADKLTSAQSLVALAVQAGFVTLSAIDDRLRWLVLLQKRGS
ncbi:MAG: class I SAM-dependent methyltransferase [Cystobacterineae bacterium]|nr:class I SAM-dependent methyltransferase [Cystobacterineae bacterium]